MSKTIKDQEFDHSR